MVLPRMNSNRLIGLTMICSSVPISRSRTIAKAVRLTTCIKVSVPITPGIKNQRSSSPSLNQGRSRKDTVTVSGMILAPWDSARVSSA